MEDDSTKRKITAGDSFADDESIRACLDQFNARYPTEEACWLDLYKRVIKDDRVNCHHCAGENTVNGYISRMINCQYCSGDIWLTAGTFFHGIRRVRPWMAAIWLLEHGVITSASKFHKLLCIAYSTAWTIFRKLAMVMQNQMGTDTVVVYAKVFDQVIVKRSRETPPRSHPRQECAAGDSAIQVQNTDNPQSEIIARLSKAERDVYAALTEDGVHFDTLCRRVGTTVSELSGSLTMLELDGLVQPMAGDRYARRTAEQARIPDYVALYDKCADKIKTGVSVICKFLRKTFHGVSLKYLQGYLAAHWCHIDRQRWRVDSLKEACLLAGRVSMQEILDNRSPASVRIACLV